jgi:D-glycero-D-manno-heptose 1,7-bisphosphate phosphatase
VKSPAVFLDRDGTLVEEVGYLDRLERLQLFPYTTEALRILARAGFRLVVITNQAGVARGYFDEGFVQRANQHLVDRLADAGVTVDGVYFCPHHPDGTVERYRVACECRKPNPGMLRAAERDLAIDLSRSWVVGDRWLDVALAAGVGARGILVRTGYGETEAARPVDGVNPTAIAAHLLGAASLIIRATRNEKLAPSAS